MEVIEEIKKRLSIFTNLYDSLRLIDPIKKKTIIVKDATIEELEGTCYGYWKKNAFCSNCISMRAFIEKDTCVKIEQINEKLTLIIATVVTLDDKDYVVEMLKDISKNSNIFKVNGIESNNISDAINTMNNKIIKDELTGVFNKRYINERLTVDISNNYSNGYPISVIMVDIDDFKCVNDVYGHVIGDKVLKNFADIITGSISNTTNWVGRYGGDEFLIVLNNTSVETAYKVSEKIRVILENTILEYGEININITSSFGAYGVVSKNIDFRELIKHADENLYKAKNFGRNRTVI